MRRTSGGGDDLLVSEPANFDSTPDTGHVGGAYVDEAASQAEDLLAQGDSRAARKVIAQAIDSTGQTSNLLWILAEVEFAEGHFDAGDDALRKALAGNPHDPVLVTRWVQLLRNHDRWREALIIAQDLPADMCLESEARAGIGEFYHSIECPAHAMLAFKSPKGLPRKGQLGWWRCWARSGGPIRFLHSRALFGEAKYLEFLKKPDSYIETIFCIDGLDDQRASQVRNRLEVFNFLYYREIYRARALGRAGFRLIPLAVLPVWLTLMTVSSLTAFPPGSLDRPGYAAISATIAMIPVIALVLWALEPTGSFRRVTSLSRMLAGILLVVVFEIGAGLAYAAGDISEVGGAGAVALGLVAAPAAACCLLAASITAAAFRGRRFRAIFREDPLLSIIDPLLFALFSIRMPRRYQGIAYSVRMADSLEFAAYRMTQYLISRSSTGGLGSHDWLARRAAGWAESLRQMQRQIIAPTPGGMVKAERFLVHEIRCLASGELGALPWTQPPPTPSHRTLLRRRAVAAVRAIVVAGLPLAVVLAARAFLHMGTGLFGWTGIITGAWALLYVLLSIDPTVRDKISAGKELADLARPGTSSSDGR